MLFRSADRAMLESLERCEAKMLGVVMNDPIALDTTMQHRQITIWHPDAIRDLAANPTVLLPDGQGEEFPARMAK